MPEQGGPRHKGQFDASGGVPIIDDSRVDFSKGWFGQVASPYRPPAHVVLVINTDADAYSSTKYVLNYLPPRISLGRDLFRRDKSSRSGTADV